MNKRIQFTIVSAVSLALCAIFTAVLLIYTKPIENRSYNLSLFAEGEATPVDWVYDQKGWTVFTQKGEKTSILTSDGNSGFLGLDYPGQTIYFSRVLEEVLDSPTLSLDAGRYTVAVFLDDVLLYTDCPEQDNRIGCLELPVLEWYREAPIIVTLPQNYHGKILTIAQATDLVPEKENGTVWICAATLYDSYSYESSLIAECFQTAIPASLAFGSGIILLFLFILQILRGTPDIKTVCGALLAFLWMLNWMAQTSFASYYFVLFPVDAIGLYYDLSLILLMVFLSAHLTGRQSILPWALTGAQSIETLISIMLELTTGRSLHFMPLPSLLGIAGLLSVLICGFFEQKKGSWFYHCFCLLTTSGIVLWLMAVAGSLLTGHPLAASVWQQLTIGAFGYFLYMLILLMTSTALATAIAEAIRNEIARLTETHLLTQRIELAQSGYETIRQQHEQVMILRHDMVKHFQLLRQMTNDAKTAVYLDNLIGQNEKIHPVIQSGNEMLDIILNSKLRAAADSGITAEIIQTQAPDKLPLSDTELCSLIMNLMDNALEAASTPPDNGQQYIKLDMHIRNNFFVFICENSATLDWIKKENTPGHGLGLKIVRQITERYGNLSKTEYGESFYRVTVILPLY